MFIALVLFSLLMRFFVYSSPLLGDDLLAERDCVFITFVSLSYPKVLPFPQFVGPNQYLIPTTHSFT